MTSGIFLKSPWNLGSQNKVQEINMRVLIIMLYCMLLSSGVGKSLTSGFRGFSEGAKRTKWLRV